MKVLVVGDLIVDMFIHCSLTGEKVEGASRVPNYDVGEIGASLGGAGLVALACKAHGAEVMLSAVVGPDDPGDMARAMVESQVGDGSLLVTSEDEDYNTTLKTRVVCDRGIVLRMSEEDFSGVADSEDMLNRISHVMEEFDGVIAVDYGKGVCGHQNGSSMVYSISRVCRELEIPFMVASKNLDCAVASEATFVVCNEDEASDFIERWGLTGIKEMANKMVCGSMVITKGKDGADIFTRFASDEFRSFSGEETGIGSSGIGSGDCFSASLMCNSLQGRGLDSSVKLANKYAARSAVSSMTGTHIPDLEEIKH